jgi:hypothetical protein
VKCAQAFSACLRFVFPLVLDELVLSTMQYTPITPSNTKIIRLVLLPELDRLRHHERIHSSFRRRGRRQVEISSMFNP